MILKLHHTQITVPIGAEPQAREFYCSVLGLRELPRPDDFANRGGLWLEVGDAQLHIGTEDGINRAATKAHVAFEVANLGEIKRALKEIDIDVKDVETVIGYSRSQFRDPFGNRIELLQRAE